MSVHILLSIDRTYETCSVVDKKLNSIQEDMFSKFETVAEKVNE